MNIDYDKFHDEIAVQLGVNRKTVKFLRIRLLCGRFPKVKDLIKHLERKEALHVQFLNESPEVQVRRAKLIKKSLKEGDEDMAKIHARKLENHRIAEQRTRECRVWYLQMVYNLKHWKTDDIDQLTKPL